VVCIVKLQVMGLVCAGFMVLVLVVADDFGEDRRSPGDFAGRQDQQGPQQSSRPLRVGADLAENACVR
jgi:hypothetical protein